MPPGTVFERIHSGPRRQIRVTATAPAGSGAESDDNDDNSDESTEWTTVYRTQRFSVEGRGDFIGLLTGGGGPSTGFALVDGQINIMADELGATVRVDRDPL